FLFANAHHSRELRLCQSHFGTDFLHPHSKNCQFRHFSTSSYKIIQKVGKFSTERATDCAKSKSRPTYMTGLLRTNQSLLFNIPQHPSLTDSGRSFSAQQLPSAASLGASVST